MTIQQKKLMENIETYLSEQDQESLQLYMENDGKPLPLKTARAFFELYLTGSTVDDIAKLNPSYDKNAINLCRVQFEWDKTYHETIISLQNRIQAKVIKAQIEAVGLYSDVIAAANKKHGYALKKYLQTGDEEYLVGTMAVKSVSQLATAINGLNSLLAHPNVESLGSPNQEIRHEALKARKSQTVDVEIEAETLNPLEKAAQKKREADKNG